MNLFTITTAFREELNALNLTRNDKFIYNTLDYAIDSLFQYFEFTKGNKINNLYLGMNPGPFGMMQTGIPFGSVDKCEKFLNIKSGVTVPHEQYEKRPIVGFSCKKAEVSGSRLWGLVEKEYKTKEAFFRENLIINYCPLCFLALDKNAKNIALDKINRKELKEIEKVCDKYLLLYIEYFKPKNLIGIGKYAFQVCQRVGKDDYNITFIIHPSPVNPQANTDWEERTLIKLRSEGIMNEKSL